MIKLGMPAPVKKTPTELQTQENEVYKALRTWYMIPGIQRELRHKENEAVQTVLETLLRFRHEGGTHGCAFRR